MFLNIHDNKKLRIESKSRFGVSFRSSAPYCYYRLEEIKNADFGGIQQCNNMHTDMPINRQIGAKWFPII
jgi:hypothetical protein